MSDIKTIIELASNIYNIIKDAKANKKQCALLQQRIEAIVEPLRLPDKYKIPPTRALENLVLCLSKAQTLVEKLVGSKSYSPWRLWRARFYKEELASIHTSLTRYVTDCQLSNTAYFASNAALDQKKLLVAQQEDMKQALEELRNFLSQQYTDLQSVIGALGDDGRHAYSQLITQVDEGFSAIGKALHANFINHDTVVQKLDELRTCLSKFEQSSQQGVKVNVAATPRKVKIAGKGSIKGSVTGVQIDVPRGQDGAATTHNLNRAAETFLANMRSITARMMEGGDDETAELHVDAGGEGEIATIVRGVHFRPESPPTSVASGGFFAQASEAGSRGDNVPHAENVSGPKPG